MTSKQKSPKDRLDKTIREMADELHQVGAISKTTMRKYSELDIPKVRDFSANKIKQIREKKACVSQPIFAKYLNTSEHTVRNWEQGKKHPNSMAMKLLNLVDEKGLDVLK